MMGFPLATIRLFILGAMVACAPLHGQGAPPVGTVFVLSAPSGTGKSTLVKRLVREVPGLAFGVSHTTRTPRPGERDGVDYFFVDDARFDAMLARGQFQEWVELYGRRYGLSRDWMDRQLAAGKDLLLDLDTTGARTVREAVPGSVTVFLLPPSARELARRLRGRGSETPRQLALRLGRARHECSRFPEYDYLVVNETVDQAFRELEAIILAARARQERRSAVARKILAEFQAAPEATSCCPGGPGTAPR
jgi:guanylate kinase